LAAAPLVAVAIACGGGDDDDATPSVTSAASTSAPTEAAKPTEAPPGPATVGNEALSFEGTDGVALKGHLYANSGPKRNVVIIVSDAEQKTWASHAGDFVAKGVAVYTYDVRGVGETGGTRNDAMLDKDLEVAVRLLKSREYVRVYVVGIGDNASTAAFRVAARQELAGVGGLPALGPIDAMPQVTEAKLFLVFDDGGDDVDTMQRAYNAAPQPATQVVVPAPPRPTSDVLSVGAVRQAILDFVSR
jgi:hypothetical protein